jgi:hypothetical protein
MSATIVGLNGELDGEPTGSAEDALSDLVTDQGPQQAAPAPDVIAGDDVPEKYQGKSARELLDIVTNQESLMGRQSTELGELRGTVGTLRGQVDSALALRNPGDNANDPGTEEDLTDRDFALDPVDATRRMVQRETANLRQNNDALNDQARAFQFDRDHPTAAADINNQDFIDFVQGSPSRQRLAANAFGDMSNIDYDSADQLWDLYGDFQGMKPTDIPADESGNDDDGVSGDQAASVSQAPAQGNPPTMVTGNSGSPGGSDAAGKPVYSQAALNELQAENPEKFWSDAVQKPLEAARAEGRVLNDV